MLWMNHEAKEEDLKNDSKSGQCATMRPGVCLNPKEEDIIDMFHKLKAIII